MELSSAGPAVLDTLMRACSQDTAVLRPAEQQLRDWETQPGFYSVLSGIFCDLNVEGNVRWLAVLCFKNGVDRFWRINAPHGISEEEKASLRQKLVSQFNEPVIQIAIQQAVLIAKIARLDCPRHWPNLLPTLLQAVKCNDSFTQQRALLVLHHVVKALASKRLLSDRTTFEELTNNVLAFILTLWDSHTNQCFQALQLQDGANVLVHMDKANLALKVLRKLTVFGLKKLEESEAAHHGVKLTFQRIEEFIKSRQAMAALGRELLVKREKMLLLLTKMLLDVQEQHPESFLPYINPSLQLCVTYNFTHTEQDWLFERLSVNLFYLMRTILRCESYRPAKSIEDTKNPVTLEAHKIKLEFFTPSTLREILIRLIGQYFVLTSDDLQSWDSAPEDFLSEESGDTWKFSLRPCTENLYLTLVKEFRQVATPVVVELLQHQLGETDPNNLSDVLKKDAVYNAVGQASFDLFDEIDFDSWFQSRLIPELQNKHANYRVLRRRVVWLIGCWVGVKFSPSLQPVLYENLLPLLQPDEDLVVRMETAFTLKIAVDDFEFKTEHFLPYLERSFGLLFQLLKNVEECETKMQILHVMSFIIERMQAEIRPYAGSLIQYLPMLWEESVDHNMLRCAILCTLTSLVQGLGPVCTGMFDFLLPVIQLSTDVGCEPHVYLCEDGIDLWYNTVISTPSITPQLLDLYNNMAALLEFGTDTLKNCLKIIEAYVLLAPGEFLQKYCDVLVKSLASLMTDLKTEGLVMVFEVIELVFCVAPEAGSRMFLPILPDLVKQFVDSNDSPMVTSMYITLISRLVLQSDTVFWELMDLLSKQLEIKTEEVLGVLLDTWLDKLDNIIQANRKKISSMALVSLLKPNLSVSLERVGGIVNAAVETMHDIYKLDPETDLELQLDCLVLDNTEAVIPSNEIETEHDKRIRQLQGRDPVHTVNLRSYVSNHLGALRQHLGQEQFEKILELVDPDVMSQLQRFIK